MVGEVEMEEEKVVEGQVLGVVDTLPPTPPPPPPPPPPPLGVPVGVIRPTVALWHRVTVEV